MLDSVAPALGDIAVPENSTLPVKYTSSVDPVILYVVPLDTTGISEASVIVDRLGSCEIFTLAMNGLLFCC